jgi:hypothetical protein
MGPHIVWLASPQARHVHDERTIATDFSAWLRSWNMRAAQA